MGGLAGNDGTVGRRTLLAGGLGLLAGPLLLPADPAAAAVDWAGLPERLQHLDGSTQVVVVTSKSWRTTYATLRGYTRRRGSWQLDLGPWPARVGYSGMTPADERVQGDGTTPAGTFGVTMAFGLKADPGTDLRYWRVRSRDQWWVGDRRSRWYNEPRWGRDGGFARTTSGRYASERLIAFPTQYAYAAVVDFNRPDPVPGRGSAIFLHVSGRGATAGCVSVSRARMVRVLRWLDPAKQPRITIAPRSVVTRY